MEKNKKEKFRPKPGQIDYTDARWAPTVSCVLERAGRILVVRRSLEMDFYPGLWSGIAGFLDDKKSLEEKAREEISEELGLEEDDIESFRFGEPFDQDDPVYGKTWVTHPILVKVKKEDVRLDWEAEEYKWIDPGEIKNFKLAPGFEKVLKRLGL